MTSVQETEQQDSSSDSEDNIPVATLLRPKTGTNLSLEQIQSCKEGPQGEKAIGVTIAKMFDGVEFRGTVDRYRSARKIFYYHVTLFGHG